MRHAQYLYKSRHGIYYFRAVVPQNLRIAYPTLPKEVKTSTKTGNRVVAGPLVRRFYALWMDICAHLESRMERPRMPGWTIIERPGERIIRTSPDDTPASFAALIEILARRPFPEAPRAASIGALLREPDAPNHNGAGNDAAPVSVADGTPVSAPQATPASATAMPAPVDTPEARRRKAWLSDVIDQFHAAQVETGAWTVKSTWTNTYAPALRLFRELISIEQRIRDGAETPIWDIRMCDIDIDRIAAVTKMIRKFPANQGKRPGSKDAKAILSGATTAQRPANADKKLGNVDTFLHWAVDAKFADPAVRAELVTLRRVVPSGPADGYLSFSRQELRTIFHAPGYVEDSFDEAWKHWAPKLGLFTAARIREIADLAVDDFREVDGIPCIYFPRPKSDADEDENDNSPPNKKRGKTRSAERLVPLAQSLIQDGLLDYVQSRRADRHEWLWDNLIWEDKSGHGRYITEWFGEHLVECGIKIKYRKVFHSFRSTLQQALERAELDGNVIDKFIGHTAKSTRAKHYDRRPDGLPATPLELIRSKLDSLDFGVTFSRSKRWSGNVARSPKLAQGTDGCGVMPHAADD